MLLSVSPLHAYRYCGEDPSTAQLGDSCRFTVSSAGVVSGLTTIHAASPTTTPARTTRPLSTPQPLPATIPACSAFSDATACAANRCFFASGACTAAPGPSLPSTTAAAAAAGGSVGATTAAAPGDDGVPDASKLRGQSKEGAGVGMTIGIVIVAAVVAVAGVVCYFKRKMASATVVIEQDAVTGEMIGTISFVNSSYEEDAAPTTGSGYGNITFGQKKEKEKKKGIICWPFHNSVLSL